jgi:hypothetical protein
MNRLRSVCNTPIPGPSPEFRGREKNIKNALKSLPEFGEGFRVGLNKSQIRSCA